MTDSNNRSDTSTPRVVVLGTAQDAGFPAAGCDQDCCKLAWSDPNRRVYATCLAIIDPASNQHWLLDCTPDFREQHRLLDQYVSGTAVSNELSGIFLTHAHIGHYSGLIHLGREAMATDLMPVHVMPAMRKFIEQNSPWQQLVESRHIVLQEMESDRRIDLTPQVSLTPLLVPHRDELSETVGFLIKGLTRSVLFIPDIDRWEAWETRIEELIRLVDIAYLDGTFFSGLELPGRDMGQIPHPLITDSLKRFADLPATERSKIRFIHFNHTNPMLNSDSDEFHRVRLAGHFVAQQGETSNL